MYKYNIISISTRDFVGCSKTFEIETCESKAIQFCYALYVKKA